MPGAPAAIAAPRAPPETSRCLAPSIPGSPRRLAGSSRPPPSRAGGLPVNGDAARRSPLAARQGAGETLAGPDYAEKGPPEAGHGPAGGQLSPCLSRGLPLSQRLSLCGSAGACSPHLRRRCVRPCPRNPHAGRSIRVHVNPSSPQGLGLLVEVVFPAFCTATEPVGSIRNRDQPLPFVRANPSDDRL